MGLISWLRKNAKAETRSAETETISVAEPLFRALMGESRLTPDMAMEIPAFSASVDFIAQTVAELPVELYREIPGKKVEKIAEDPRLFPLNDEVRYMEDREPIGFNYVKLGLQDVLLDPKTGEIYTPNTNQLVNVSSKNGSTTLQSRHQKPGTDAGHLCDGGLTVKDNGDIIEERARHYTRGDHG